MSEDYFDYLDQVEDREPDEADGVDIMVDAVLQERDKAIQVSLADNGDLKWIPKSCIHSDSEVYCMPDDGSDGAGKLVLHHWFAEQEGYI